MAKRMDWELIGNILKIYSACGSRGSRDSCHFDMEEELDYKSNSMLE